MASARHGLSELTLDIDLTSSAASNTTLMILLDVGVEFAKENRMVTASPLNAMGLPACLSRSVALSRLHLAYVALQEIVEEGSDHRHSSDPSQRFPAR